MPVGPRQRLVRRVLCVRGEMSFRVEVDPRFDYGREAHETVVHEHGVVFRTPALTLALASGIGFRVGDEGVLGEFSLQPGESESFVLETVTESHIPHAFTPEETLRDFEETVEFWRRWLSQSRYRGRWRETVHRSALVLKLLTYEPSGAMVAAPTTSLPEQIGGGRNWDYRYTWIRDTAFSLYALLRLGFTDEAAGFMDWLTDRFRERVGHESGPLQIMYAVDGSAEIPEEVLDHLEGYRASAPVRIGNGAANQLQLDIYGELIDSVYLFNKHATPISHGAWSDLARIVEWVCENWDQADEGIWETRGGRQHFTFSRLMCWVAVERAIRMARQRGLPADIPRWSAVRDDDLPPGHGPRLERRARRVRPALRLRRPRRLRALDAADEVHGADRSALALDAGCDLGRARLGQPRLPLQRRGLARRARRATRGRSRSAPSGTSRPWRARATWTRRGSRSRRCSRTRTTSASTPRRSGRPASSSATSRRPSRTSR